MLKYSVIIPVYNVENYLPRCLDSLLAQNYADLEILLIDNGSKDQSGQICEDYATKFQILQPIIFQIRVSVQPAILV